MVFTRESHRATDYFSTEGSQDSSNLFMDVAFQTLGNPWLLRKYPKAELVSLYL